ncbi:MAG: hypothetical protein Kow00105_08110 [Phycisphaeraceae bacterium]
MSGMSRIDERIGVCTWSLLPAGPDELIRKLRAVDINKVQLALSPLVQDPGTWGNTISLLREADIEIISGMFSPIGEDYSTLETIRETGGVVPDEHWSANLELASGIAAIAGNEGVRTVTFHAGFVPHDANDPGYTKLRDRLKTLADVYAEHHCQLLLETGQETADDLLRFLDAVNKPNLGVNFDPANMILYGKGDPVDAVRKLVGLIRQVHIKDAVSSAVPGEWGTEVPVGEGEVDWPAFMSVLQDAGYAGCFVIEREAGEDRVGDIKKAVRLIRDLGTHA